MTYASCSSSPHSTRGTFSVAVCEELKKLYGMIYQLYSEQLTAPILSTDVYQCMEWWKMLERNYHIDNQNNRWIPWSTIMTTNLLSTNWLRATSFYLGMWIFRDIFTTSPMSNCVVCWFFWIEMYYLVDFWSCMHA